MVMAALLAISLPAAATAQRSNCNDNGRRDRRNNERNYNNAYYQERDRYDQTGYYDDRSAYQKHRKIYNYAITTGAGAIIGALIGGKKGALIGAGAGALGGFILTKKQKPKTTYYRRY